MERKPPDVSEPRAPDKPDDDSQPDDDIQPRAPDKPDDDSRSVPLIKPVPPMEATSTSEPLEVELEKKWTSMPLEDDNTVRVRPEDHSPRNSQDAFEYREKKWISVPLEDDNTVRVRPEDHSHRNSQDAFEYHEKKWTSVPLEDDNMRWLGAVRMRPEDHSHRNSQDAFEFYGLLSIIHSTSVCVLAEDDHETFSNLSRDVTFSDIKKIETEKPVAMLYPVPPAPPPPNPPI